MIEELVVKVFATRAAAHLAHWKTKSYAQHAALGDFYDAIIDQIDGIVEAYQGSFGLIDVGDMNSKTYTDIVKQLEADVVWIAKNRSKIAKDVYALENLIDGLTETYLKTLYKLKNLS